MMAKPMGGGGAGDLVHLLVLLMLGCCLHLVSAARTHREHKVHNIVLYPDKHSWCKTTPIKQVVAWPGCVAREIDNNVCVGACFSYTIPQTEPSAPGDVISPYCDSCQPSEVTWLELTLECTNEEEPVETLSPEPTTTPQPNASSLASNMSNPPLLMQKRVQVIANCSCSACHGHAHHHTPAEHSGHDGDAHHQPSLLDVPELMGLMRQVQTRKMASNHSSSNHHPAHPAVPHLSITLPEVPETEEEEKKEETSVSPTEPPAPPSPLPSVVPMIAATSESLAVPPAVFELEPPVELPTHVSTDSAGHGHHPHAHSHHPHHHSHHHPPPAHIDVPQETLQPAQEGAEMSYQDNLVPSDQSQEKDEEF